MRCISSSEMSRKGVGEFVPAPLSAIVSFPNLRTVSAALRSTSDFLVTSAEMKIASPPASLMAARRFSALVASRPTIATLAPACAKAWAMALQSSPVPPVTMATSPLRENWSSRNEVMLYPQQGWRLYEEAPRDYNRSGSSDFWRTLAAGSTPPASKGGGPVPVGAPRSGDPSKAGAPDLRGRPLVG